ncbi:MAG TPA: type II secretion system protein [Jatrophihabitans sp.]|jgi:Tfp pilus assembly protein PilV|uniref:type II secretion system protein n=1 Tax=Jatrophihabitans sp. TaxID=1932789 RepID=UPI002E04F879|nr:type II secretion system protein [Jatrophihabitans sp.]
MAEHRPRHEERGETLLELIVAIGILGVCVLAVGTGLALAIKVSSTHREAADAGTYLHNYAEQLSASYVCGTAVPAPAAGVAMPGFGTPSVSVTYWDGSAFTLASCPGTDPGLEQMKISLASSDSRVTQSLIVVVRKP